jgi:hypothetical protein
MKTTLITVLGGSLALCSGLMAVMSVMLAFWAIPLVIEPSSFSLFSYAVGLASAPLLLLLSALKGFRASGTGEVKHLRVAIGIPVALMTWLLVTGAIAQSA